jgi:hypothetical protein
VAASLEEAGENLLTFYRFPESQWRSLRTTNAIERMQLEFRRRVKTQAALPNEGAVLRVFFGLWIQRTDEAAPHLATLTSALSTMPKGLSPLSWLDDFLYLPEVLYALFFIWLICSGPGKFSIDYWLAGKLLR